MSTLRHKQPVSRARAGYQRANEEAARIIQADPLRYPGLPQTWALAYMARIERDNVARIGPLFRQAAA